MAKNEERPFPSEGVGGQGQVKGWGMNLFKDMKKSCAKAVSILWSLIALFYVSFICLDLFFPMHFQLSAILKLAGVSGCAVLAFVFWRRAASRFALLTFVCALLTVCADVFLLFSEKYLIIGLGFFYLAHSLRTVAFARLHVGFSVIFAGGAAGLAAGVYFLTAPWLPSGLPVLDGIIPAFCAGYAVLLLTLAALAFAGKHLPPGARRPARWGMALFLLCDICVMLMNAGGVVGLDARITQAAGLLIWVFYLPSQGLLAMTAKKSRGEHYENLPHHSIGL